MMIQIFETFFEEEWMESKDLRFPIHYSKTYRFKNVFKLMILCDFQNTSLNCSLLIL
jgi:hypothetical protein